MVQGRLILGNTLPLLRPQGSVLEIDKIKSLLSLLLLVWDSRTKKHVAVSFRF